MPCFRSVYLRESSISVVCSGLWVGLKKSFSLPVLLAGLSLVFLVGNGYVAAECLFVLGGSFFYKFEYCYE